MVTVDDIINEMVSVGYCSRMPIGVANNFLQETKAKLLKMNGELAVIGVPKYRKNHFSGGWGCLKPYIKYKIRFENMDLPMLRRILKSQFYILQFYPRSQVSIMLEEITKNYENGVR